MKYKSVIVLFHNVMLAACYVAINHKGWFFSLFPWLLMLWLLVFIVVLLPLNYSSWKIDLLYFFIVISGLGCAFVYATVIISEVFNTSGKMFYVQLIGALFLFIISVGIFSAGFFSFNRLKSLPDPPPDDEELLPVDNKKESTNAALFFKLDVGKLD